MIITLKVLYYFISIFLLYIILKNKEKKGKSKKIDIVLIIIFAIIFGYYGIISGSNPPSGDRLNYGFRFENVKYEEFTKNNSIGLYIIEHFLHYFTFDMNALFFTIPALYFILNMISFYINDDADALSILLIHLCIYGILGFFMFKQCFSLAFISISVPLFNKKNYIKSLIAIVIGIIFHEATWIVIPVFLACIFSNKSKIKSLFVYLILIISTLFFQQISKTIVGIFNHIPGMDIQISGYLNEEGQINSNLNYFTALKGFPFYLITIYALIFKETLKEKILYFNNYLIMSFFVSITSFLSYYMYWMYRFGEFFYFPVIIFGTLIYKSLDNKQNKKIFIFLLTGSLMFLQLKLFGQYFLNYGGFGK